MTSMASSLGNRSLSSFTCGSQRIRLLFSIDDRYQPAGHFRSRRPAVYLVVTARTRVVLHQRVGLGTIVDEPFLNLFLHVVRAMDQQRAAAIADGVNLGRLAVYVIDFGTFRTHQPAQKPGH